MTEKVSTYGYCSLLVAFSTIYVTLACVYGVYDSSRFLCYFSFACESQSVVMNFMEIFLLLMGSCLSFISLSTVWLCAVDDNREGEGEGEDDYGYLRLYFRLKQVLKWHLLVV